LSFRFPRADRRPASVARWSRRETHRPAGDGAGDARGHRARCSADCQRIGGVKRYGAGE